MAIKIFCNGCQKYIRDAKYGEIASLKGTEICSDCESRHKTALDEVEKIARRGIVRIETARDKIKADIEEAMRNVIKPKEKEQTTK
ncbi:MAG: hypothetical protein ACYS1A_19120 [Planctomycetota bacterium]|jgi:hypothetical protein